MSLEPSFKDVNVGLEPNSDGTNKDGKQALPKGRLKSIAINILAPGATPLRKGELYIQVSLLKSESFTTTFAFLTAGYLYEGAGKLSWDGDIPLQGSEWIAFDSRGFKADVKLNLTARVEVKV